MLLEITNWQENFENSRTRQIQNLSFVLIPNDMSGDGYTELLDDPDGPQHFACWIAILAIASKCEPRGLLIRKNGLPHDARSMARISRIPQEIFDVALLKLLDIKWLSPACQASDVEVTVGPSPACQASAVERKKEQKEQKEQKEHSDAFETFWTLYPKKVAKKKCAAWWESHKPDLETLLEAVLKQALTKRWQEGYIPDPITWLHQERWADDPASYDAGGKRKVSLEPQKEEELPF